jgi:hypothetical protein
MPQFFRNIRDEDGKLSEAKKFGTFGGVFTPTLNMKEHISITRKVNSSCMFILDSDQENIFA